MGGVVIVRAGKAAMQVDADSCALAPIESVIRLCIGKNDDVSLIDTVRPVEDQPPTEEYISDKNTLFSTAGDVCSSADIKELFPDDTTEPEVDLVFRNGCAVFTLRTGDFTFEATDKNYVGVTCGNDEMRASCSDRLNALCNGAIQLLHSSAPKPARLPFRPASPASELLVTLRCLLAVLNKRGLFNSEIVFVAMGGSTAYVLVVESFAALASVVAEISATDMIPQEVATVFKDPAAVDGEYGAAVGIKLALLCSTRLANGLYM